MSELLQRIAALSPEQRELLVRRLKEQGALPSEPVAAQHTQDDSWAITPISRDDVIPLSFAQQRLWFLDQLEPGSSLYNVPMAIRFSGALDVAALWRSLRAIIHRHEALRTLFVHVDGHPHQQIVPYLPCFLPLLDVGQFLPAESESIVQVLVRQAAQHPFDLAQGPLWYTMLVRVAMTEHLLLLTFHHIVFDEWSMGVLFRELRALYVAYATGRTDDLAALPVQYPDFAHWQRRWLQGEVLETQLRYWRQQLGGGLPLLELPVDRPRPPLQSFRGARHSFQFPNDLSTALGDLSRRENTTLFMLLLAAFQLLLARYSGQDDVLVGTPIANRTRVEIEGLIGIFANTLVVRTDFSGNPPFATLLKRVREVTLAAYAHQDVPFERLVDELQPQRDMSRNPLFQVMFSLQKATAQPLELPGMITRLLDAEGGAAKFDLWLSVSEGGDGVGGFLEYATDIFDAATTQRLLEHFQVMLAGIVANPACGVADMPLLTAAERAQQLVAWNATQVLYPQQMGVSALFAAQAEQTPDAIALFSSHQHMTFCELDCRGNQLAHYLQGKGVGPDVCVGVYVERSLALMVGLMGVLKAGGAYVPIDPEYPPDRVTVMLADAEVALVLTQAHLLPRLVRERSHMRSAVLGEDDSFTVVPIDTNWSEIARLASPAPLRGVTPDNLAYVIYTSGSTGKPKGAMITQGGLTNYLRWCLDAYALSAGSGAPVHSSLAFDLTVTSMFTPLLAGRCVWLLPETDGVQGFDEVFHEANHFSLIKLTPAHLEALGHMYAGQDLMGRTRAFIVGGEALLTERVAHWRTLAPDAAVFNEYGPTETVVGCCVYRVPQTLPTTGAIPIGRPIANTELYILDARMHPVPVGVLGELYVGGAGVARGYLNRPDLTAERFVPNPFGREAGRQETRIGTRLYRTGDVVRYCADGVIEFCGRRDHQVKVRGFRIELGEIEAVIAQYPAVRAVAVLAREDTPGQRRLVAYVALPLDDVRGDPHIRPNEQEQKAACIQSLRHFLQTRLPDYMVPALFVLMDTFPLTHNGKVDRQRLPAPDMVQGATDEARVAPRTTVESQLADIWAHTLGLAQVGVHDNFFALGGDSILSIQIVTRANQVGLRLTTRQMFQYQTIAELALVAGVATVRRAEQSLVTGPVLLTPIQHWFFAWDLPDPHHYNQAVLLETRVPLVPVFLAGAAHTVVMHHDALRLRFTHTQVGWEQRCAGCDAQPVVTIIDLSVLSEAQQVSAITQCATQAQASLDLTRGPLVRLVVFRLGSDRVNRLLVVVHHLLIDSVSWSILLADLHAAYTQQANNEPVTLPPKTTSFQQWAERLTAYAQSPTLQGERAYWQALTQSICLRVPLDEPQGVNTLASECDIVVALGEEETSALLTEVPGVYQTQINDVLLTALVLAFGQWAGEALVFVDMEGHGREELFDDVDITRTIGWFTSIFPVLLDARNQDDPGAALKAIKEQLRQVPQRGIGYGLLHYLHPEATITRPALPEAQISFNYLGQRDRELVEAPLFTPASESVGLSYGLRGMRRHVLVITGIIAGGQLHMRWNYSAALHRRETITHLAHTYLAMLSALIAHCRSVSVGGYTPSDFPLAHLDQATLDRIVGQAPQVVDIYPLSAMQQGLLFHTLYEPAPGVYITQLVYTIRGNLALARFQQAWQAMVDQHPIFRTAFVWEGLEAPLQLVYAQAKLPWEYEDWCEVSKDDQAARLSIFLADDRRRGFVMAQAPLMRCALFRIAHDTYYFVRTNHHLLLDGWSQPLVLKEVMARYAAGVADLDPRLMPGRPYREYIGWLQRQDMIGAEVFWRDALAGFLTPTPLVIDRPFGEGAPTGGVATAEVSISASIATAVQMFVRQHGLTLNTLMQGLWALLLSRYSGERDIVFGATVAIRPPELPGADSMIGLCINTLPVRLHVPATVPFVSWLAQVQTQLIALRQYEYSPLVLVQSWSSVLRGQPLFESIVVFENYPFDPTVTGPSGNAGLQVTYTQGSEQSSYPLEFIIVPDERLLLRINYDRARFDAGAIQRMLGHIQVLLEDGIAHPDRQLADVVLVSGWERRQILEDWNATARQYAVPKGLHELITEQAQRTPDAVALLFNDAHLAYGALDRLSEQLAHHLRGLGGGPDVLVGICMERSLELVIGLLGILKAGAAYVPIDPSYPTERQSFMLADCGATIVLIQQRLDSAVQVLLRDGATTRAPHRICVDVLLPTLVGQPTTPTSTRSALDTLAYVIYTSGSTGTPKGAMNSHRAIVNRLCWMQETFPLTADDAVLQKTPFSFDVSVWEFFWPLLVGARLVIARPNGHQDPAYLIDVMAREAVTTAHFVPSMLQVFLETPDLATCRALRRVICSGEALPYHLQERFFSQSTAELHNLYGPTEAAVDVSWWACSRANTQATVPIGRPIANTTLYILDQRFRPVPVGVTGELYIGGIQLARGYLQRPDLTAERFIPNPFIGEHEMGAGVPCYGRLYRTGDVARYLPDGSIEYLGRSDQQVKLRGFRIELGEIEARLMACPAVKDAVVLAWEDTAGEKRLVAYIVPRSDQPDTRDLASATAEQDAIALPFAAEVRAFAREWLPEYMVPRTFVVLAQIPLTPNGKVDRHRLPAPQSDRPDIADSFVAPHTDIEQQIAGIWCRVLQITHVGVHDNFFDLGGHSLLMLRVYTALHETFHKDISLIELFRYPTIQALAGYIASGSGEAGDHATRVDTQEDRVKRKIEVLGRKQQRKGKGGR